MSEDASEEDKTSNGRSDLSTSAKERTHLFKVEIVGSEIRLDANYVPFAVSPLFDSRHINDFSVLFTIIFLFLTLNYLRRIISMLRLQLQNAKYLEDTVSSIRWTKRYLSTPLEEIQCLTSTSQLIIFS